MNHLFDWLRMVFDPRGALRFMTSATPATPRFLGRSPSISITPDALAQMTRIVSRVETEVGWLGTAVWRDDDTILIDRIFLFKQEVTGATTRLLAEGQLEVMESLLALGPEGERLIEHMRFWGHSHVNFACSPSGQDDQQMSELEALGSPFWVRGILNKRGEARFDVFDYRRQIVFEHCPWSVELPEEGDSFRELDKQLDELLRPTSFSHFPLEGSRKGKKGREAATEEEAEVTSQ